MYEFQVDTAALVGNRHITLGKGCEDVCGSFANGSVTCVTCCDGGGSFALAKEAAAFQAHQFAQLLVDHFSDLCALRQEYVSPVLGGLMLAKLRTYSEENGLAYDELSSTFFGIAVHRDGRYLAVGVGDGSVFEVKADGSTAVLLGPEPSEAANVTSFVNHPMRGLPSYRWCRGRCCCTAGFVLTSDGLTDFVTTNLTVAASLVCRCGTGLQQPQTLPDALHLMQNKGVTEDDMSLAVLAVERHVYPYCLYTLPKRQRNVLRRAATQPAVMHGPGVKKHYSILRQLKREGYLTAADTPYYI